MKAPREMQLDAREFMGAPPWLARLFGLLNEWTRDVRSALSGGLTFEENFRAKSFDVVATSTSDLMLFVQFRPAHVLVTRARESARGGAAVTASVSALDWEFVDAGNLHIRGLAGLTPGTSYDLRILVIGGAS